MSEAAPAAKTSYIPLYQESKQCLTKGWAGGVLEGDSIYKDISSSQKVQEKMVYKLRNLIVSQSRNH